MKKWMVVTKGRRYALLHYNEDLKEYKGLPIVPDWVVRKYVFKKQRGKKR